MIGFLPRFQILDERSESLLMIGLVVFAITLVLLETLFVGILGHGLRAFDLVNDDSYYYINTAILFWETGSLTFDTVTTTNGFQPLWLGICILLAAPLVLIGKTWLMPVAVLLTGTLLLTLVCVLLVKILRLASLSVQHQLPGLLLLVTVMVGFVIGGMETMLMLSAVAWFSLYWLKAYDGDTGIGVLSFASLSLLVVLSRLDLGIFVLVIYIFGLKRFGLRKTIISGLIVLAVLTPYLIWNYTNYGHVTPISGKVKEFWEHLEYYHYGPEYLEQRNPDQVWRYGKELGQLITDELPVPFRILNQAVRFLLHPYLALGLLIGLAVGMLRLLAGRGIMWTSLVTALLVHGSFQLYYYNYVGHHVWLWYVVITAAAMILIASAGSILLLIRICGRRRAGALTLALSGLYALFVLATSATPSMWNDINASRDATAFDQLQQIAVIDWLNANVPKDQVIGAWAAGVIGFRTDSAVINLEGLVSDNELLESNRRLDLVSSILKHNVGYITQPFSTDPFEYDVQDTVVVLSFKKMLVDFRSCFDVPFEVRNEVRSRYVFKVDLDCLTQRVADQRLNLTALSAFATIFEAEGFEAWSDRPLVRIDLRGVWRFYVEEGIVSYNVGEIGGGQTLVARVFNKTEDELPLVFAEDGNSLERSVQIVGIGDAWQCIRLSESIPTTGSGLITIPKGLALDALILVDRVAISDLVARCVK